MLLVLGLGVVLKTPIVLGSRTTLSIPPSTLNVLFLQEIYADLGVFAMMLLNTKGVKIGEVNTNSNN